MMLLISNKCILHLSIATLIPSIQNWRSWTNRSKPIVFTHTPKQSHSVQINAPEYDSNIDGQIDTLPDIQPQVLSHAENTEDSAPVTANTKEYSAPPQDSDRLESQSKSVQNPAEYSPHQDAEQFREQHKKNPKDPN